MSETAPHQLAPGHGANMSVMTICDGFDAAMRLAGFIAQLPADVHRTDLEPATALERLQDRLADHYDLVVIAPDVREAVEHRQVIALLDLAKTCSENQVVLLPPKADLELPLSQRTRVLHGPPFARDLFWTEATPPPPEAEPADSEKHSRGFRSALWRSLRKKAARVATDVVPQQPPAAIELIAVQPIAGGAGATTFAANLASEIAALESDRRVLLIDLDIQFGSVALAFDLPDDQRALDLYGRLRKVDSDALLASTHAVNRNLSIIAAPSETLPLDGLTREGIGRLLAVAGEMADVIVIDLPISVADWTEEVWTRSDLLYGICTLEVRSALHLRRLRSLSTERVFTGGKFQPVLNRAPSTRRKEWLENLQQFETGLGRRFVLELPDGRDEVARAAREGLSLSRACPQNPLTRAIKAHAAQLSDKLRMREPIAVAGTEKAS